MHYETSPMAVAVFAIFVIAVIGLSFFLGSRARSAQGFFAAHGEIPWFVNGIAFAGDYLSAASFLGICGMIAFYGYDGFLYSIGYLAGWIVALFVIAEPLKRLGKFTFADALDKRFHSRGIKLAAAVSTLVVSIFYLIPQMVGAGALIKPLLGLEYWQGVLAVGGVVVMIVVTAGMVSTTWVQFIKGGLLVVLCTLLTILILCRGLTTQPGGEQAHRFRTVPATAITGAAGVTVLEEDGVWKGKPYTRIRQADGSIAVWRKAGQDGTLLSETQTVTAATTAHPRLINGRPQVNGVNDLLPVGAISTLPGGVQETGPLGPIAFLSTLQNSEITLWKTEAVADPAGTTTVYYQAPTKGSDLLLPGASPTFKGLRGDSLWSRVDFLSLMLALLCGTAALPHILIRYYTVKDQASARKSTMIGIAAIGFFYVLTLFLGLGAMTSGGLDVTNNNMSAPLLARTFGGLLFAVISAVAFTTVLGTVSGLIMAASGAVAHDIATNLLRMQVDDARQVRIGKLAAIGVGILAMALGILFERMNVTFLVGWAFSIAASANLPALIMLLFWSRTTKQGITVSILVGMVTSLAWILLSGNTYKDVYGLDPARAIVPFSQPAIVTIPLSFAVLVVVSLFTQRTGTARVLADRRALALQPAL